MEKLHSIDHDQKLYVLKAGKGYTCLGFDVCQKRSEKLCYELGLKMPSIEIGTNDHYEHYLQLLDVAKRKHVETGWRSESELNPKLIGLEGKRIEATVYGERIRFYVGKSTGWIPCHLEIKTSRSTGGSALPSEPEKIQDIRVIR